MTPCGEVQDAAHLIGYQVLLGAPAGQAAILQFHTALEIHRLPATEVLDVIGRMHGSMLRMRQELHDHSQSCQMYARMMFQRAHSCSARQANMLRDRRLPINAGRSKWLHRQSSLEAPQEPPAGGSVPSSLSAPTCHPCRLRTTCAMRQHAGGDVGVKATSWTESRAARQLLGQTIETIGSHWPDMAADLGLTMRPDEAVAEAHPSCHNFQARTFGPYLLQSTIDISTTSPIVIGVINQLCYRTGAPLCTIKNGKTWHYGSYRYHKP